MICAFGLIYFLYRQRFALSVASMAALMIMASNFTNIILIGVFLFSFIFYSNRLQKSFIVIYMLILVVFLAKVSPQNNEHIGRIFYQAINKPYDLPPVKVIPIDELKKMPDSLLNEEERKKKFAQVYIDSMNSLRPLMGIAEKEKPVDRSSLPDTATKPADKTFYEFRESKAVREKINEYNEFLGSIYEEKEVDSLKKLYNWKSPGKWIAAKQLADFFQNHRQKIIFGNGIGNFSSRIAFKATMLDIAGRYPARFKYIASDFLFNHLYLYLYYHAQDQSKHEASNTPDSVYFQLAGEYGIVGLALLLLYFVFFVRYSRRMGYGLPLVFLLAGSFFAEYWFEQFSIVILFELLSFLDMKDLHQEGQTI
jgi:hypothetical protein